LELLAASGATASFFLTGERAQAEPGLVQSIIRRGHQVFCHGWRHIRYDGVPESELVADLRRAEAALTRFRPTPSPYLVRLPYGSGHESPSMHRALRRWHPAPQIADWDHSLEDWRLADECHDTGQLRAACQAAAETAIGRPGFRGSILMLHESPYGVSAPLISSVGPLLLEEILHRLEALGLRGSKIEPLGAQCPLRRYIRSG
jgi:peptidoglycan/xylan/chitin deacetylase (PgdA/CDA1 family)